jgi:hypothetical protein
MSEEDKGQFWGMMLVALTGLLIGLVIGGHLQVSVDAQICAAYDAELKRLGYVVEGNPEACEIGRRLQAEQKVKVVKPR